MCAAIEATLDRGVEETPHQFRFKKAGNGPLVNFAIVVTSATQIYEHVGVLGVVADPLNETRPGNVSTKEWREIDRPPGSAGRESRV